ncbi:hypothetical protein [Fischerella thermalis]|jgi:hypothetical protein|uniref:Uncharacterized protein n=1 Tax=Fischerella thermalis JSC-11 TaxID=741277 RepID=G6FV40_9CYAN|nr:hypothetical protein [Fischerella thermalis]PMB10793.1 hypothetical protein CEN49_03260 [Fischerella thermalis CCMEE 5273]PMB11530.1 hypothetical protein CI592_03470 [Fischerella thermalis CCMEE 5328]EHC12095.1 hypothetical protein FJSC11DRAFT_2737 [Fischerella thermalis JSC-11]MBF1991871.1 hypothetical protein [Fischerella thermalis M58_A2018_009]MBF2060423.1 hypothetical protein [Fischerella thermalis M66_A2018_004]
MLEIGWFSAKLFLKGKLIRDPQYFWQQTAIGAAIGLLLLIIPLFLHFPLWLTVILSSIATGAIMPLLLQDFKMK